MCRGSMISFPKQCTQQGQRGRKTRGEMTCPKPYGEQVAEPSKVPGAAVQSLQVSLTPSRKWTEEFPGVLFLQTSKSSPSPSTSLWNAAAAMSRCGYFGHSFCLRGYLQIIQWSKDGRTLCTYKEITEVFNFWWRQLFGKKRFPFFVEPDLRGLISCAPQIQDQCFGELVDLGMSPRMSVKIPLDQESLAGE